MWIFGVHQAHIITVNFWQKQLSKKKKRPKKSAIWWLWNYSSWIACRKGKLELSENHTRPIFLSVVAFSLSSGVDLGVSPTQVETGSEQGQSLSRVWLCATPWAAARQAPLSVGFPGKKTGVGCHFLLQGVFPTQGLNPGCLYCRQIPYCLSR